MPQMVRGAQFYYRSVCGLSTLALAGKIGMKTQLILNNRKVRRTIRTRAKITGTALRPRLAVFRSNKAMSAQLIDDTKGKTIAAVSSKESQKKGLKKSEVSFAAGELIAEKASKAGVKSVVFDRRSYAYHGRVKAFADGARKGGLKF